MTSSGTGAVEAKATTEFSSAASSPSMPGEELVLECGSTALQDL